MAMYNLIIKSQAISNLKEHVKFLANVSVKASVELENDFYHVVSKLTKRPFANREIFEGTRRVVLDKRYAILYEVEGQNIKILAMYDCRMEEYADLLL